MSKLMVITGSYLKDLIGEIIDNVCSDDRNVREVVKNVLDDKFTDILYQIVTKHIPDIYYIEHNNTYEIDVISMSVRKSSPRDEPCNEYRPSYYQYIDDIVCDFDNMDLRTEVYVRLEYILDYLYKIVENMLITMSDSFKESYSSLSATIDVSDHRFDRLFKMVVSG